MTKFNLKENNGKSYANVDGTPQELVELISTIMIENDVCARLILAATEVYHANNNENKE